MNSVWVYFLFFLTFGTLYGCHIWDTNLALNTSWGSYPHKKINLLGGQDAEKQLKKRRKKWYFLKNPRIKFCSWYFIRHTLTKNQPSRRSGCCFFGLFFKNPRWPAYLNTRPSGSGVPVSQMCVVCLSDVIHFEP